MTVEEEARFRAADRYYQHRRLLAEIDALRAALDAAEKIAADEAAYWDVRRATMREPLTKEMTADDEAGIRRRHAAWLEAYSAHVVHPAEVVNERQLLAEIDALRAALDAAEKIAADEAAYWDVDARKQLDASDHVGHGWSSAKADLARRIERKIRALRGAL